MRFHGKVSVDRLDHLDQILFEKANADRKRFQSLIEKMRDIEFIGFNMERYRTERETFLNRII